MGYIKNVALITALSTAFVYPAHSWESLNTSVSNSLKSSQSSSAYSSGNGSSSSYTWTDGSVRATARGVAVPNCISGTQSTMVDIQGGSGVQGNAVAGTWMSGIANAGVDSSAMIGNGMGDLSLFGVSKVEAATSGNGYFEGSANNYSSGNAYRVRGGDVKNLWTDGSASIYTEGTNTVGNAYQGGNNSIVVE